MIINNGKIKNIDINLKCNQRYFIRYLFKNRIVSDKTSALEKLENKFCNDVIL